MNIRVFSPSDMVFTSNGNKSLKPISSLESKVLNCDQWYIDVELSIDYVDFIQQDAIVVAPTKYGYQPFRITNAKIGDSIEFDAHHVGFDSKLFIIDSLTVTNVTAQQCLDAVIGATTDANNFTAYSDVTGTQTLTFTNCTLYEALLAIQGAYGGYIDFNVWQVRLTSTLGADRGVVIEPGKNLESAEVFEDWNSVCTTILPIGNSNIYLTPKTRSSVITYDRPYTRVVKFNTSDVTELETLALAYLDQYSVPKVNYKVNSTLQNVYLNDEIQVNAKQYTLMANVLSYKYNTLRGLNESVEFGNYIRTAKRAFSAINEMIEKINNNNNVVNSLVAEQTKLINAAGTYGYAIKTENEVYFVDSLPIEDAVNVMRQNVAGIGFSTTGIDGPYTSAWTLDGKFNADFIKTGTIDVARIRGDLLDISGNIAITSRVTQESLNGQLTSYSTIAQTASAISLEIGNLKVGTKNYIKNSTFANGFTNWMLVGSGNSIDTTDGIADGNSAKIVGALGSTSYIRNYFEPKDIPPGQKVVVSCLVKSDSLVYGTTNPFVRLYTVFEYTDLSLEYPTSAFVEEGTRGWYKLVTVLTTNASKTLKSVSVYGYGRDFTGTAWFEDFKFEVGTKVTDWSPYPGELFGAKYTFDANNAVFTGGGLIIKNNAGTTVFDADVNGDLQITGKLTALSGNVKGDLTVGQTSVNAGLSGSGGLSSSIRFWAGYPTPSTNADFYVRDDGYLKANKGAIAGWLLSASQFAKGGIILDSTNERIYVGGSAYLYSYASGVIGISGQLRSTGNMTAAGSINAQGGLGVTDGQIANLGNTVHIRFGTTKYLITRDTNGFLKATTVITE